jgi:hypothetical protein
VDPPARTRRERPMMLVSMEHGERSELGAERTEVGA